MPLSKQSLFDPQIKGLWRLVNDSFFSLGILGCPGVRLLKYDVALSCVKFQLNKLGSATSKHTSNIDRIKFFIHCFSHAYHPRQSLGIDQTSVCVHLDSIWATSSRSPAQSGKVKTSVADLIVRSPWALGGALAMSSGST